MEGILAANHLKNTRNETKNLVIKRLSAFVQVFQLPLRIPAVTKMQTPLLIEDEQSATLRVDWPHWFPPAYVHTYWRTFDPTKNPCLSAHSGYAAAKAGSVQSATAVVEALLSEPALEDISGCLCGKETFVIAPIKPPGASDNVLAYTFAEIVAGELGIDVFDGVFQYPRGKRDLQNFWMRLSNPAEFYGDIAVGCDYILADDVLTVGGTLSGLRALIESQGGRVICMTALAGGRAGTVPISLDSETSQGLKSRFGASLNEMLKKELGYGVEQLTEPEARKLLGELSVDGIRAQIVRARRRSNAG